MTTAQNNAIERIDWRVLAPVLVVVAGICWGIIGLFSTALANMGLSSIQITVVRCVIAATCFGTYLLVRDRDSFKFRIQDIWMFLGTGIVSIAFFNICYFGCIKECNLSIACILLYTAPCFVTLMSRALFKEALTRRKVYALIGAFCGCVFVVGLGSGDATMSIAGILMGFGSGIGYALYSIFGRFALARYSTMAITFYTFFFAAIALLPFSDAGQIIALAASSTDALATMLLLGIISTVAPFACYTNGLAHMETSKASIMAFIEPMVALIVGALVFHDALTWLNYLGIVLIAGSVLLLNLPERKNQN